VSGVPPPDVIDIAGLSMHEKEGSTLAPGALRTNGRVVTHTRVQYVGTDKLKVRILTCTVSGSCNPSSSRADLVRSANKDIFERSKLLLFKGGALSVDVDGGKGACLHKSARCQVEPSMSIVELLSRSGSQGRRRCRDCKNVALLSGTVRLDNAWLSLGEICIDGGVFTIAAFDDEAGARLDPALSISRRRTVALVLVPHTTMM
jgi:hypothetical protein